MTTPVGGADGADLQDAARTAHLAAESNGEPGYLDPETGWFVFTRAALLANGACCGSGCRHCPYRGQDDAPDDAPGDAVARPTDGAVS